MVHTSFHWLHSKHDDKWTHVFSDDLLLVCWGCFYGLNPLRWAMLEVKHGGWVTPSGQNVLWFFKKLFFLLPNLTVFIKITKDVIFQWVQLDLIKLKTFDNLKPPQQMHFRGSHCVIWNDNMWKGDSFNLITVAHLLALDTYPGFPQEVVELRW